MDARLSSSLRHRADHFGGVCYIPARDDFFAISPEVYRYVTAIPNIWTAVPPAEVGITTALARLGICETRNPASRHTPFSGPSFIGSFQEIVTVREPLVVNCFATSFCPLKCIYCHADDLMQQYRADERDHDVDNVAATAATIPAMVAVVTGGDPITRPARTIRLIDRLASQRKALVLDTSGVGSIDELLPSIREHQVHVRISIDAVSEVNDRLRPSNLLITKRRVSAFVGAVSTLRACLDAGIPVTVQTVVTNKNDNESELRNLRDWLVANQVRHWVLHIAVRGGSARRIEEAARKHTRNRGIVPQAPKVYDRIRTLMTETDQQNLPLDIRCTDTGNTPNSVLLISSSGDLFTEGLAHSGKVKLFAAGEARPDRVRALWHHLDHFGHARRYLNWNPWFYEGQNLVNLCYRADVPMQNAESVSAIVETEGKYRVADLSALESLLHLHASASAPACLQRDEYYDTNEGALEGCDFVVRIRKVDGVAEIGLKGPRFRTKGGEYSRIELEFEAKSEEEIAAAIRRLRLQLTWYFEKRRSTFRWRDPPATVVVDEVPQIGAFIEIEGSVKAIRAVTATLQGTIGGPESRNYKEIFLAHMQASGRAIHEIRGAGFAE